MINKNFFDMKLSRFWIKDCPFEFQKTTFAIQNNPLQKQFKYKSVDGLQYAVIQKMPNREIINIYHDTQLLKVIEVSSTTYSESKIEFTSEYLIYIRQQQFSLDVGREFYFSNVKYLKQNGTLIRILVCQNFPLLKLQLYKITLNLQIQILKEFTLDHYMVPFLSEQLEFSQGFFRCSRIQLLSYQSLKSLFGLKIDQTNQDQLYQMKNFLFYGLFGRNKTVMFQIRNGKMIRKTNKLIYQQKKYTICSFKHCLIFSCENPDQGSCLYVYDLRNGDFVLQISCSSDVYKPVEIQGDYLRFNNRAWKIKEKYLKN